MNRQNYRLLPRWRQSQGALAGGDKGRTCTWREVLRGDVGRCGLESFDTRVAFAHPTYVLTPVRRLAALTLAVVLSVGQGVVCAGWLRTPEARMACCLEHAGCARHESESDDGSQRSIAQVDADRCCAASERDTPAQGTSAFGSAIVLAIVPLVTALVPAAVSTLPGPWGARTPVPVPRIPRHLLLSVLIV